MISGSPLISALCFIAQWVPSDLAAHSPSSPLWNRGRKSVLLSTEIPFPPSLYPGSLCTVSIPITQTATSSFIWACQPFPWLFTLPPRSRAASCHIFWATCILISAWSNLCLWWAFSMSCLSANRIFPCSCSSHFLWSQWISSLLTCDVRVSCSQELRSMAICQTKLLFTFWLKYLI